MTDAEIVADDFYDALCEYKVYGLCVTLDRNGNQEIAGHTQDNYFRVLTAAAIKIYAYDNGKSVFEVIREVLEVLEYDAGINRSENHDKRTEEAMK